jgi:hypothetical protein
MKSDYEKLKAFAEELNPENERGISNLTYEYKNDTVVFYYSAGNISIFNDDGELGIDQNSEYGYGSTLNLDKWIDETREYWRDKGLPSLQNTIKYVEDCSDCEGSGECQDASHFITANAMCDDCGGICQTCYGEPTPRPKGKLYTMPDLSGESFDVQRRHSDNIKGKLYEMPNTVVHLKTQGEYDEYIQMCEDVGWKHAGIKSFSYNWVYAEIKDNWDRYSITYNISAHQTILSLQGLKERIGVGRTLQIPEGYTDPFEASICKGCENRGWKLEEGLCRECNDRENLTKTNAGNTATKIMNNIKNTAKRLLLSEPEKTYVKAGLMDIDKNWGYEALQTAKDQVLDEFMATKKFKDQMTEVAKAIIEEN